MAVSYNKLWKLLIDRKMKKKDLMALSGVSKSTLEKSSLNLTIRLDFLCISLKMLVSLKRSPMNASFLVSFPITM